MKLRNKKTGEIVDDAQYRNFSLSDGFGFSLDDKEYYYRSLTEFNKDWEDYEEPKEFWFIDDEGGVECGVIEYEENLNLMKQIGNYFETREEAEEAVEKLKAWQRLKDKGFRFVDYTEILNEGKSSGFIKFEIDNYENINNDLDLLFGGEE